MNLPSIVTHPLHYNLADIYCLNCNSRVECWMLTECYTGNLANAIKYIWRCDHKGKDVKDLQKALAYLKREISSRLNPKKPHGRIFTYVWANYNIEITCDFCGKKIEFATILNGFKERLSKALELIFNHTDINDPTKPLELACLFIEQEIFLRQNKLEEL